MERVSSPEQFQKFKSPEEELRFLQEQVRQKERELQSAENSFERGRIAKREIAHYADTPAEDTHHETYAVPSHEITRTVLNLEPESHDDQVDELLRIASERGIKTALQVAARMNSPHIEDDLHRALVRWVAEGLPMPGITPSSDTWKALSKTLFEVQPYNDRAEGDNDLEHALKSMEQLYAGLLSLIESDTDFGTIALEIASPQGTEDAVFYIAIPRGKEHMFERHLLSIFPGARLNEMRGDYNVFFPEGSAVGAVGALGKHPAFPIRTYESFTHDPMNMILSAFSKLSKHGEGVALQIIVGSAGNRYNDHYGKILDELQKGKSLKEAVSVPETAFGEVMSDFGRALFSSGKKKEEERNVDTDAVERVSRKLTSRILPTTIRLIASARDEHGAENTLSALTSTLSQFEDATSNHFTFKKIKGSRFASFVREFSFRSPDTAYVIPLNLIELTSMYHLSTKGVTSSREIRRTRAKQAAAPTGLAQEGVCLGENTFGGARVPIHFSPADRLRHFYCIGQTGTGKTALLKNMIIQDMERGDGVAFIDPHGSDIQDILAAVPPHRRDDVIYFDPSETSRPMGLNMLEYDPQRPEQKTFVVNELLAIFEKLYEHNLEGLGPMFQQYFRNAALLVVEDPETGGTLAEVPRVLSDPQFRKLKLSRCKNPVVRDFWTNVAGPAGGEAALENIVPYITSKTDTFLANDIIRPIVSQEKSSFDLRQVMDEKKIFLANLSKGRIGDMNAELLGLIIVGKFLKAAFSRTEDHDQDLPVFHLYIDEFQNFTTPSIATILSEARKYKLTLNIAHQFIGQLRPEIRDAVFGNVGTKCILRVGADDAEFLAKSLAPVFEAGDVENQDNFNAYVSLLVDGRPASPFNIELNPPKEGDRAVIDDLKELSYYRYGRPRVEIEREIMRKMEMIERGEHN